MCDLCMLPRQGYPCTDCCSPRPSVTVVGVLLETGSLTEMKEAEAAGQARGYPPSVTLQLKDDILQCQPLHVAAEKGRLEIVQVGAT